GAAPRTMSPRSSGVSSMTTSSTPTNDVDPPSLDGPESSFGATHPRADASLREARHRVWGVSDFRPLQREAMHAILDRRDSVVVLPTGGGKSLCFQAPAVVALEGPPQGGHHVQEDSQTVASGFSRTNRIGVALVVSPLISLMK